MILSEQEQEYLTGVDKTLRKLIDDASAVNGTPGDVAVILLSLIAKQQAQTNALLTHMIHFAEGKEPDGGEDAPMKCKSVIEVKYPRGIIGQEPCPEDAIEGGYCEEHLKMHKANLGEG